MPQACPVEFSRSPATKNQPPKSLDATGLSRGVFTFEATKTKNPSAQMPRACPVEFHDRRYKEPPQSLDATGLSRGVSRALLHSYERDSSTGHARGIQVVF